MFIKGSVRYGRIRKIVKMLDAAWPTPPKEGRTMIFPRKLDGSAIAVFNHMATGRVYVDAGERVNGRSPSERRLQTGRGGPWAPLHHCRFEDYGLADDVVRCRKCGLVQRVIGVYKEKAL